MLDQIKVLIIGSGAREHAFALKISKSNLVSSVFIAPGNGGTEKEFSNLPIASLDFDGLANAIVENDVKLVLIGPEQPLVDGIVDFFQNHPNPYFKDVSFIGPDRICAMLEGSKDFSKQIMIEAGIPTAKAKVFSASDWEELKSYISNHALPVVIKADGLASGKGVAVCFSHQEALDFSASVLINKAFGESNSSLLVEEFLDGIEVSMFVLTDGIHYQVLPEAKDYKRIFNGDLGPNTGGMGAVSPVWFVDDIFTQKVKSKIIDPLFITLKARKLQYKGFLFIGLMKVGNEPIVIEFNARMGDPETQTVLARIRGDIVPALLSIKDQKLDQFPLEISPNAAATVVLCAENYPETPTKGDKISIQQLSEKEYIFHAGTQLNDGKVETNGGRVLSCTAEGESLETALQAVYNIVEKIKFRGMQFRTDIGKDLM